MQGLGDSIGRHFLNAEAQFNQASTPLPGHFPAVEHIRNRELVVEREDRLKETAPLQIDEHRRIGDEDGHSTTPLPTGSSIRLLSSRTLIPSSSAALASEIAFSASARKHRRSKRRGSSSFKWFGS